MNRLSLRMLLATLGFLLERAGRWSKAFRRQITRDLVVEISSADGVARHFVFTAGDRNVSSRPGPAPDPMVALRFERSGHALWCLASPFAVGLIVRACLARKATISGNPVLFLWFYGLTRIVLPINRQTRLRRPLPGALVAPDPASPAFGRVTREPAQDSIDPKWINGITQHRKLAVVMGAAGETIPMV